MATACLGLAGDDLQKALDHGSSFFKGFSRLCLHVESLCIPLTVAGISRLLLTVVDIKHMSIPGASHILHIKWEDTLKDFFFALEPKLQPSIADPIDQEFDCRGLWPDSGKLTDFRYSLAAKLEENGFNGAAFRLATTLRKFDDALTSLEKENKLKLLLPEELLLAYI